MKQVSLETVTQGYVRITFSSDPSPVKAGWRFPAKAAAPCGYGARPAVTSRPSLAAPLPSPERATAVRLPMPSVQGLLPGSG